MFIGNLVKLKDDTIRNEEYNHFVKNAIEKGFIFLITSMDNEDLDYIIQLLYLDDKCDNMIQLGGELLVTYDEIEVVEIEKETLFKHLNKIACDY